MSGMIDPSVPLADFQKQLKRGRIKLAPCEVDPTLFVYEDRPKGQPPRSTYVRLDGKIVTAFVIVAPAEAYRGLRCFAVGCATPEAYQGQGRAKEVLRAAIAEMKHQLSKYGVKAFYLDACIGVENIPSQRLAEAVFGTKGKPCIDGHSREPALQYYLKVTSDP